VNLYPPTFRKQPKGKAPLRRGPRAGRVLEDGSAWFAAVLMLPAASQGTIPVVAGLVIDNQWEWLPRRNSNLNASSAEANICRMSEPPLGYARVSTTDQNLEIQEAALRSAGCDLIRSEKRSGTTTAGRTELQTVLDFLRKGDVLMVTRNDRLARSIGDLQDIVRTLRAKGAALKAQSSRSIRARRRAKPSSTCSACSLSSRRTFAENAN
jgi:Resolvase, N terminal domain